jgi:hypothetical protein
MSKTNEQVAEETVVGVLRALRANDAAVPARHSQQTPRCPPISRFVVVANGRGQWTAEETTHLRTSCPFCERVLRLLDTAKVAAAQEETVVDISGGGEETVGGLSPRKPGKPAAPGDAPKPA